mmetsp:Transcript_55376/g.177645  ORF Transcript_55376/g.177645 Transcript_55376/m.177645 type:complete len:388 (+) Transcript_55376:1662-2825(+)
MQVRLDEGVVRHDICHARPLHLLHPVLGLHQVSALYACVKNRVVDYGVQADTPLLQGLENADCTWQVLFSRTIPDHCDVLGHVGGRRIEKRLRQVTAATTQCRVHEALLHACVQQMPLRLPDFGSALVDITCPLELLGLHVEADECRNYCRLLGPCVIEDAVGQGDIRGLIAECEQGKRKVCCEVNVLRHCLLEERFNAHGVIRKPPHQEAIGCVRERHALLPCQRLHALDKPGVLLADTLGEHQVHCLLRDRRTLKLWQQLRQPALPAHELQELAHNLPRRCGGRGGSPVWGPSGLQAAEVLHCLVQTVCLQGRLDDYKEGTRRERDLAGLHLGGQAPHLGEASGHEVHAQEQLVGPLVRLQAQGGQHLQDALQEGRVEASCNCLH